MHARCVSLSESINFFKSLFQNRVQNEPSKSFKALGKRPFVFQARWPPWRKAIQNACSTGQLKTGGGGVVVHYYDINILFISKSNDILNTSKNGFGLLFFGVC